MNNDLPPPKPPLVAPALALSTDAVTLSDGSVEGSPVLRKDPLPSLPVPEPAHTPEHWAKAKGTPDWALAAARARHLQPGADGRASWLENGVLTEAAFDAALDLTLNGSLR